MALVAAGPVGEHGHEVLGIVHCLAAAEDATVSADDAAIMMQLDPVRPDGLVSGLPSCASRERRAA
jgi:hypothetical protein